MALQPIDIANGVFSIIFVSISILIGLTIISKYFEYKRRTYLLIGLTWIGMSAPWTPSSISLLTYFLFGTVLPIEILLFIAIFFLPIVQIFWIMVVCVFKEIKKRKLIVGVFIVEGILFEIYFILNLLTNPSAIGEFSGTFDMNYRLWVNLFLFSLLIIFLITGTMLALESYKSEDREVKLRGKFLFLAFYSFIIGSILDIFSATSIILLTIARLILISSAFEFYNGFILPDWMKKRFVL
jgi:hypothetical protein